MLNSPVSVIAVYKLLLKSYRHTWFSLTMVGLSLLIACAGLSAVLLINQGAKQSYTSETSLRVLPAKYQITAVDDTQTISSADYASLKRSGVPLATAVAETSKHLYREQQRITQRRVRLLGVDFLSLLNQSVVRAKVPSSGGLDFPTTNSVATSQVDQNRISGNLGFAEAVTLIHPKFLKELGLQLNQSLQLNDPSGAALPPLATLSIDGLSDTLVLDIGTLLAIDKDLYINRILLLEGTSQDQLSKAQNWLPEHLKLAEIVLEQSDPQMTESFYLNLFAMALLMFAVCLFIVMNACNLLISKRFAMLKIFRQLGIGRRQIIIAHGIEFLIFAAVISGLGIIVGGQLAMLAAPAIRNIVEGLYRVQLGFGDTTWLSLYLKVLFISVAGISLALILPVRQLNQSLSHTQSQSPSHHFNAALITLCAVLSLLSMSLLLWSSHLSALLLGAAALILAGCCGLIILFPLALKGIMRCVPHKFTLTRVSVAQALFLSKKTKIACCAFFIAATSNLGMNLMVDSFRSSTEGWLTQRLVVSHYLYSNDAQVNEQLQAIANNSGVALYPRYEQTIKALSSNVQLFSYPVEPSFKKAMVFAQADANVWQSFEDASSVLVNQQFAIRNDLSINDNISFSRSPDGRLESYRIGGIIYDYGNPSGQILLAASQFTQSGSSVSIFAVAGDPEQIRQFASQLEQIGINIQEQFYASADILAGSMEVFDRTFIITDSLNLVTLLVAALSLACTIVILLEQSRPQTMLLRALGVTAWQGRRLLLQQYIFLCVVALICATPFGILLSYVLIEQINYHAFNWSYPLIINWVSIVKLYVISILIVVMVVSIPIIYTTKQSLSEELRWLD
jgi:putative ABC transport system permease protein